MPFRGISIKTEVLSVDTFYLSEQGWYSVADTIHAGCVNTKDYLVSTKYTREVKLQIDTECAKEDLAG